MMDHDGMGSFHKIRNYIAGELKKASKTLPIVIHSSMGIVLTLMLLTNWSYLVVLPLQLVTHSNTIALDFGRVLLGPIGGLIFSLIVAISCLGALNSSVFTTCRLVAVAAKEGWLYPKGIRSNQPEDLDSLECLRTTSDPDDDNDWVRRL